MPFSTTLNKNFLWTALQVGIRTLTQLAVLMVLSRALTAEEFGIGTIAVSTFYIIWPMFEIGLESTIIQRPDIKTSKELLGSAWTMSIIILVLASGLILLASWLLPMIMKLPELKDILLFFLSVIFIRSWAIVPLGITQRNLNFHKLMLIESVAISLGLGGVTLLTLYLGGTYWAFPAGVGGYYIISSALLLLSSRKDIGIFFRTARIKEITQYSIGYATPSGINTASREIDKLLVQYFLGTRLTGIYGRAIQIYQMPANLLGQIVEKVVFPSLVDINNSKKHVRRTLTRGTWLFSVIIMPISVLIFFTAESIVFLLLGNSWSAVITPLKILSFAMFFRTNSKLYDSILRSSGQITERSKHYFYNFVILIILIVLLSQYGLIGMSISVAISSIFFNFQLLYVIHKKENCLSAVLKSSYTGIILATSTTATFLFIDNILAVDKNNNLINILFHTFVLIIIYLFYFLLNKLRENYLAPE